MSVNDQQICECDASCAIIWVMAELSNPDAQRAHTHVKPCGQRAQIQGADWSRRNSPGLKHTLDRTSHLHPPVQVKGVWLHKEDLAEASDEPWQGYCRPAIVPDDLLTSLSSANVVSAACEFHFQCLLHSLHVHM